MSRPILLHGSGHCAFARQSGIDGKLVYFVRDLKIKGHSALMVGSTTVDNVIFLYQYVPNADDAEVIIAYKNKGGH
ncbi:hypothetical protein pEaSNUABM46_00065 [Erwinia phage pEa_SNUABM_46]|nr:hypothetical protein pEaSNUABM45_00065 [Erwinia phage pEa_SNUABM_45]QYW04049.1 hypothetical protein pEaSNUABM46_00065 [Erwinia phage pEa_SNUABM_46]